MKCIIISILAAIIISGCVQSGDLVDEIKINDVKVLWFGHASFEITDGNTTIYIDPYVLPGNPRPATYILVSHDHFDHCSPESISMIQTNDTRIITTMACIRNGLTGKTNTLKPGEFFEYKDMRVEAVPAYNTDKAYHPKDSGIGFVVTFRGKRYYFAGDTDSIPEMSELKDIYLAFLPIGGTYTMDTRQAAEAAKAINPVAVVPMHYNSDKYGVSGINADPEKLKNLLKDTGIKVIIMKPVA